MTNAWRLSAALRAALLTSCVLASGAALLACGDDSGGGTGTGTGGAGGSGGTTTATAGSGSTGASSSTGSSSTGSSSTTGSASTTGASSTGTTTASATGSGGGDGGGTGDGGAGGAGGGPSVELPDVYSIVQEVANEHPDLLETNTYESCGILVQYVLMRLNQDDPEWGHVAKTQGESQYSPPDWVPVDVDGYTITGFSQDAIFHRAAYRQVDIIANSSANSDPDESIHGPGSITWGVIDPMYYRENNPWMATVPLQ
jgi:hypothetical protein